MTLSRAVGAAVAALAFAALPATAQRQDERDPSWTPEIVVTGQRESYAADEASVLRTPVPIKETPQSVQVLTRTLLDEQEAVTLPDALRNVSGVVPSLPSEAVLANPIVRGFESELFIDGLVAYGDTSVVDPGSLVAIERIEVAKGPTSVLFGGGTGAPVGGLVNLVTRVPTPEASYAGFLRAGSFELLQGGIDLNQPLGNNVGIRLTAEITDSEDDIDFVTIDRFNVNPSLRIGLGDTELLVRGGYSEVEQLEYAGLPATIARRPDVDPFRFSGATDAPRTRIENRLLTGVLTHRFSEAVSAALQLRRYESEFDEFASFPFFAFFPGEGTRYPIITGRLPVEIGEWTVDGSVTARFSTGAVEHVLLAGAQYDTTDYEGATAFNFAPIGIIDYANLQSDAPFGAIPPISGVFRNEYRTTAVYVQDQLTIGERLHLLAALRYSNLSLREIEGGVGNDVGNDRVDPRLGVAFDVAEAVTLYAGYATGARLSLFFNGVGTPPRPETSEAYEAGLKLASRSTGLTGTLALYRQVRENVPTPDPTTPFASVQSGRQRAQGIEADVIWEPSSVSFLAAYAYTDSEVIEDNDPGTLGDRLPRVPDHSGRLAVRYRFNGVLDGLGIGAGLTAASAAEITLPNSERGDSYAVVDLQASYEAGPFRIGVNVQNLVDERYFIPYQYLNQAVVRPGTPLSAHATLAVRF